MFNILLQRLRWFVANSKRYPGLTHNLSPREGQALLELVEAAIAETNAEDAMHKAYLEWRGDAITDAERSVQNVLDRSIQSAYKTRRLAVTSITQASVSQNQRFTK